MIDCYNDIIDYLNTYIGYFNLYLKGLIDSFDPKIKYINQSSEYIQQYNNEDQERESLQRNQQL